MYEQVKIICDDRKEVRIVVTSGGAKGWPSENKIETISSAPSMSIWI